MKYTNIIEKLACVLDIIFANWYYLAFIGITALILTLLALKLINRKKAFLMTLIGNIILLGVTIYTNSKPLSKIGNSIVNNIFTDIYFPSAYVYLFILIIIDIVTFVYLMKKNGKKSYKWIHSICFFIIQFILTLILELLSKNKIDIFSKVSLFSNKNLVILLELSTNIFIIWLIVITFVYLTNLITDKIEGLNKEENTLLDNNLSVDMSALTENANETDALIPAPSMSETPVYTIDNQTPNAQNKFITNITTDNKISTITTNNNITIETTFNDKIATNTLVEETKENNEIDSVNNMVEQSKEQFNLNEFIPTTPRQVIPEPTTSETVFEKIINNDLPIIHEETIDNTDNYTLNDYRLFNKILKEIKEHNHNNTITIDKNLEYRLITKYSTKTFNMFKKMLKIYSN